MKREFSAVDEERPGETFRHIFQNAWPSYSRWWLSEGDDARPSYLVCRRAMRRHMPELLPLYEEWCELAGGGDQEARFLSLYCPPAYLSACSQAIWTGPEPLLVRNYDYDPRYFDALVLRTRWLGERRVLGMADCLVGLLDGINDAGLAVSLTFGGPRITGEGFGIPLIIRYLLETCSTTREATRALTRIPCHMAYNVTVLDKAGGRATVMLTPGQDARVTRTPVATNHQPGSTLRNTSRVQTSVDRERFLLRRLTMHVETAERFVAAFLRPPLYSTAFASGYGTLYTAAYRPLAGELRLHWPGAEWTLSLDRFEPGTRVIGYRGAPQSAVAE
ncbi:MAG: C45 family peptidase [Woeseiaceae bacterium]|nr:C45 family peptidase [Woeseiaceae bacterium]